MERGTPWGDEGSLGRRQGPSWTSSPGAKIWKHPWRCSYKKEATTKYMYRRLAIWYMLFFCVSCFEINNCNKKFQNECMFIIKRIYKIQKPNSFWLFPIAPIPLRGNATDRLRKKGFQTSVIIQSKQHYNMLGIIKHFAFPFICFWQWSGGI